MDYLNMDINVFLNNEVRQEINGLKSTIVSLEKKNTSLLKVCTELQEELVLRKSFSSMISDIKSRWLNQKSDIDKCEFIELLMLSIFEIKKTFRFYDSGGCLRNIIINYYDHKVELIQILNLLDASYIEYTQKFKMPYDWGKEKIMMYAKKPHYCVNGDNYGVKRYYVEDDKNAPHDLIQENKFITDLDVFTEIIKTLESKQCDRIYLYTVPDYNKQILPEHIRLMGRTLIGTTVFYDIHKKFIHSYSNLFDVETLDFLYQFLSHDNQYKMFYWQNFPVQYQQKYIYNKPLKDLLSLITDSKCKWTDEQKTEFLKDYLSKKGEESDQR